MGGGDSREGQGSVSWVNRMRFCFLEPGGSEDALPASLHCTGDDLKDQPGALCPGSEGHCGDSGDTTTISSRQDMEDTQEVGVWLSFSVWASRQQCQSSHSSAHSTCLFSENVGSH